MTLTAIKIKIKIQLSRLTIDDFYFDPNLGTVKGLFAILTGQKSEAQIEKYLSDKYFNTLKGSKVPAIEKLLCDLNHQIKSKQNQIKKFNIESDFLSKESAELEKGKAAISKKTVEFISDIKEIDVEIQLLLQIPNKSHYIQRLEELEKAKRDKISKLDSFPVLLDKINSELQSFKDKKKSIEEHITSNEQEIKNNKAKIIELKEELKTSKQKEITFYNSEYTSLRFLFSILLKKSIKKAEEVKYLDKSLYVQSRIKTDESHDGAGAFYVEDCDFKEYFEFVTKYINTENNIPDNWRKLLYQILSSPLPNLAGTINQRHYDEMFSINRETLKLTNSDISSLLAIKSALKKNHSIRTSDHRITLALSGGVSATIVFRDKGDIIGKFQKQQLEIYAKCMLVDRFVNQTLYHQNGYANSKISIETPGAYYLLTTTYVVEIDFNPAPILFDNSNIVKTAPNLAVFAKREAEMAALEAEEKITQRHDDDYFNFG